MSDPEHSQQQPTYTPASFEKRTAAWMGIAYALMLLFVTTFYIFTGKELPGTFPLLLLPIYRQRKGTAPGGIILTVLIILIALAAIVLGLALGGPALIHAIRTAYA